VTPLGWRLSAAQWAMLTAELQLDGHPVPLQVRRFGSNGAEVADELEWLGLLRAGRVDADLEAALRVLNQPASWLDSVWLADAAAEQPVRVVAARSGTMGVCALQHPDQPGATVVDIIRPRDWPRLWWATSRRTRRATAPRQPSHWHRVLAAPRSPLVGCWYPRPPLGPAPSVTAPQCPRSWISRTRVPGRSAPTCETHPVRYTARRFCAGVTTQTGVTRSRSATGPTRRRR
jgi:hypothetical protein